MNNEKNPESHVSKFDIEKEMAAMRHRQDRYFDLLNEMKSEFTVFRSDLKEQSAGFRRDLREEFRDLKCLLALICWLIAICG